MRRSKLGVLNAHSRSFSRLSRGCFSLIAVPAQAPPATVYIYKVYYNSPGSDTGRNTSLNAEYVVIRNGDDVSHSISTVRMRPDTSTSSAPTGWELASRPSFTPARAPLHH